MKWSILFIFFYTLNSQAEWRVESLFINTIKKLEQRSGPDVVMPYAELRFFHESKVGTLQIAFDAGDAYQWILVKDGENVAPDFDWERFTSEYHFTVDNLWDKNLSLKIGKQRLTMDDSPSTQSLVLDPLILDNNILQMMAATVSASGEWLDEASFSFLEGMDGQYDNSIDDSNLNFQVKVKKAIFKDQFVIGGSYAKLDGEDLPDEKRAYIDATYYLPSDYFPKGSFLNGAYVYMDNNPRHPFSDKAFRIAGATPTPFGQARAAVTHIEEEKTRAVLGHVFSLKSTPKSALLLNLEVCYDDWENPAFGEEDGYCVAAEVTWHGRH